MPYLKRWESPRREGRNDKGRGGSARMRQLKKRQQMLRQKLKENQCDNPSKQLKNAKKKEINEFYLLLFFNNFYSPHNWIKEFRISKKFSQR